MHLWLILVDLEKYLKISQKSSYHKENIRKIIDSLGHFKLAQLVTFYL